MHRAEMGAQLDAAQHHALRTEEGARRAVERPARREMQEAQAVARAREHALKAEVEAALPRCEGRGVKAEVEAALQAAEARWAEEAAQVAQADKATLKADKADKVNLEADKADKANLEADMAACSHTFAISAPEKPGRSRAIWPRSTSDEEGSNTMPCLRQWMRRISSRSSAVGCRIVTLRSKRPGRTSAGSRRSA